MTKFAATSIDRRAALTVVAGAIASALPSRPARALYPDKYIKLIVPFPAGGGGDTLARTVAGKAGDILGQQFVIENRPGAGGNIGSTVAAAAAPDGYTVLYGTNGTLAINHALYKSTGFDPLKDFEPVGRLTEIALVAVVHPSVPATSIKELIEIAKAKPGTLNIATAGNGTTSHLAAEMFKRAAGVDMQIVHYRGGGAGHDRADRRSGPGHDRGHAERDAAGDGQAAAGIGGLDRNPLATGTRSADDLGIGPA